MSAVLKKRNEKSRVTLLFKAAQHFLRNRFIVMFEKWTPLHKSLLRHVLTMLLLAHTLKL